MHNYCVNSVQLERVESIVDLGVTIDNKLRFNEHVATMTAKAFSVLGFVRRNAAQLTDIYALKSLYCALVRSILEYASPVWSPYYASEVIRIERVQKQFIRFALRNLPWNDPLHLTHYQARCRLVNLELLSERRKKLQQLTIFDILCQNIDCAELLQQSSFNVPQRPLRNHAFIIILGHTTNYGFNSPLSSCIRAFNTVSENFDFNLTKQSFKARLRY